MTEKEKRVERVLHEIEILKDCEKRSRQVASQYRKQANVEAAKRLVLEDELWRLDASLGLDGVWRKFAAYGQVWLRLGRGEVHVTTSGQVQAYDVTPRQIKLRVKWSKETQDEAERAGRRWLGIDNPHPNVGRRIFLAYVDPVPLSGKELSEHMVATLYPNYMGSLHGLEVDQKITVPHHETSHMIFITRIE